MCKRVDTRVIRSAIIQNNILYVDQHMQMEALSQRACSLDVLREHDSRTYTNIRYKSFAFCSRLRVISTPISNRSVKYQKKKQLLLKN